MSLADELLADPDFGDSYDADEGDTKMFEDEAGGQDVDMSDLEDLSDESMGEAQEDQKLQEQEMKGIKDVRKVAKLLGSSHMRETLSVSVLYCTLNSRAYFLFNFSTSLENRRA